MTSGTVRFLAVTVATGAALLLGAGSASAATRECEGLQMCVPVAGPWVVVPTGQEVPRPTVEFLLSCPRGYVVGGIDAELSDPATDLVFHGLSGSPVNPGITTSRAIVFVATHVGAGRSSPTFRSHIGCMPAAGGGQRVPSSVAAVYPPGHPTVRRVRNVRLVAGQTRRIELGCVGRRNLVSTTRAVGFYTEAPPSTTLISRIVTIAGVRAGKAVVLARTGAIGGVRAIVQVGVVCSGGS